MTTKLRSRLRCVPLEERVTPTVAGGTSPEQIPTDQFLASFEHVEWPVLQKAQSESDGLFLLVGNTKSGVAIGRVHRDGSLDQTFGTNGITTIETGIVPAAEWSQYSSFDVAQDGRIVMHMVFSIAAEYSIMTLVFTENGSFDNSFGTGGKSELYNSAYSSSSIIDSQGRIVISTYQGYAQGTGNTPPYHASKLLRLTTAGTIDTSFGNSGWTDYFAAKGVMIGEQPTTGRIVAIGGKETGTLGSGFFPLSVYDISATAFLPTGQLDSAFGKSGSTTISIDQPNSSNSDEPVDFFFRPDGEITIVGTSNREYITGITMLGTVNYSKRIDDIAVVHLTANGQSDQAFGGDGVELYPIHALNQPGTVRYAYPVSASFGSADSILIKSYFSPDGKNDQYQLTRIQSFGQIDQSYGTQGTKIYDLTSPPESTTASFSESPEPLQVSGAFDGGSQVLSSDQPLLSPIGTANYFGPITVRTVSADVNGDGVPDLIGGAGPGGGPHVIVIDGKTKFRMAEFFAFEQSFFGGINVTAGDLNGDGKAEIVVTPDRGGGPIVAVYDGAKLAAGFNNDAQLTRFYGIEDKSFRGGARAAVGDVDGDGTADLLVSAGFEGGPRISLYDGTGIAPGTTPPPKLIPDFFAFESTLRNGAYVTLGDLNGDGQAELVFGGGPGGAPRVRAFDGKGLLAGGPFTSLDDIPDAQLANFYAGDSSLRGGIRLAIKEVDGSPALLAASGENEAAQLRVFPAATLIGSASPQPSQVLDLFDGAMLADGVFVG